MLTFWENPQRIRRTDREYKQTNPFTWEIKKMRNLQHKLTPAW
jgi:hypothetical protein